jgi:hypothetical protein
MSYPDPKELIEQQERADEMLRLFNQSAPRAMDGETVESYRRRMATRIQQNAPNMKDINVRDARGSAFDLIEKQIYDDARREALRPTLIPDGELREVKQLDATGRPASVFYGRPSSWMGQFSNGTKRRLVGIKTETQRGYIPNT